MKVDELYLVKMIWVFFCSIKRNPGGDLDPDWDLDDIECMFFCCRLSNTQQCIVSHKFNNQIDDEDRQNGKFKLRGPLTLAFHCGVTPKMTI